jgi:uncharacterized protein (UPF0248 family)
MKTFTFKLLALFTFLCLLLTPFNRVVAQCTASNGVQNGGTRTAPCGTAATVSMGSGESIVVNVNNGNSYTFATCGGATWDTYLTLTVNGGGLLAGNDDGCSTQSTITYVSNFTGQVRLLLTKWAGGTACNYWQGGGTANSATVSFYENLPGAPSLGTTSQTDCGSSSTLPNPGGAIAGEQAYWQGTNASGTVTNLGTPTYSTVGTTTYYIRSRSTGGCWGPASAYTVTLRTPSSGSSGITLASGTQTQCSASPTSITLNSNVATIGSGGTIQWYGAQNCVSGNEFSTASSVAVTPAAGTSTGWSVRVTNACNSPTTCQNYVATHNVSTTGSSGITLASGTQTQCSATPSSITLNANVGTVGTGGTIQWYTGNACATTLSTGASVAVTPTSNTSTSWSVRVTGACNGASACQSYTASHTISSTGSSGISLASGTQTQCSAAPSAITLNANVATVGTGGTIQWYNDGTCTSAATTGASYSPTPASNTSTTWSVRVTGACNGSTTCQTYTASHTISSTGSSGITLASGTQNQCSATPTAITLNANVGTVGTGGTIQWYNDGTCTSAATTGASYSPTPASNTSTTWSVRVTGACNSPTTCQTYTASHTISSTGSSGITLGSGTQTQCSATPTSITLNANVGTIGTSGTIQWYNDGTCTTGFSTGSAVSVTPVANSSTTWSVRVLGACNSPTTCQTYTATHGTSSTGSSGVTLASGMQTQCSATPSAITLNANVANLGLGGTIQWYNDGTCTSAASTGASYSPTPASNTSTTYSVRVTGACNSPTTCQIYTASHTISSTGSSGITLSSGSQTQCSATPSAITLDANVGTVGTGGTIQWYNDGTCTAALSTGASATVTPNADATTTWSVRVTGACNSPTTCQTYSATHTTSSTGSSGITLTSGIQNQCSVSPTTITLAANVATVGTGGTIQWYNDGTCTNQLGTGASVTVTPTLDASTTWSVRVTGACNSPTTCETFTATHGTPTTGSTLITLASGIQTQCSANPTPITLDANVATLGLNGTIQWYSDGVCGTALSTGSSVTVTPTADATTTWSVSVTGACNSPSSCKTYTATHATPLAGTFTATIPFNSIVCAGQALSATLVSGSGGTGTITDETQVSVDGGNNFSPYSSGASISTSGLTGGAIVQVRTRRVSTGLGCLTPTAYNTYEWTVVDQLVAQTMTPNIASGSTICQGQNVSATQLAAGSGGGITFTDELEFSTDGGSTWSAYTFSTPVNTTTALGSNAVRIRTRRIASGIGCTSTAYNTLQWTVVTQPEAPTFTPNVANGTTVCRGILISATFTPGTGGVGSTEAVDYSITGGATWVNYTSGLSINTATVGGANVLLIRSRRTTGTAIGCNADTNLLSWPVLPQPVAQTLNPNVPNNSSVCQGQNLSATQLAAGSGGGGVVTDELEFSTNGGSTWAPYTFGTAISTTGLTGANVVQIRTRRTATLTGCVASAYNTAQWTVTPQPVAGVITPNITSGLTVCRGQGLSATITSGSGGAAGASDFFEFSTNTGTSWSTYTQGSSINTITLSGVNVVQIRARRTTGTSTGCVAAQNMVMWSVVPQPVAQTMTPNILNGVTVCQGQSLSATLLAAASGGDGTIVDELEFSTDAGASWSAYTFGTSISTNSLTGTNVVRIRTRRTATSTGCVASAYNTLQWSVVAKPVAAALTPNTPNGSVVCRGQVLSATFTSGSGGSNSVDVVQSNNGTGWQSYTSGQVLNTSVLTINLVQIRSIRTVGNGTSCSADTVLLSWPVVNQPVAQTMTPNIANNTTVCQGQDLSATLLAAASGGTGTIVDELEFSIDVGASWSPYTFGNAVNTSSLTGSNVVRIRTRRTASGINCNATAYNLLQWSVVPQPVAPALTPNVVNGSTVCSGQSVSATFIAGSGGLGSTDLVQFSTNGGSTWTTYASGTPINTTSLSGTDIVQIRSQRSAGTGTTCNAATILMTWTVAPAPLAPALVPNVPSGTTVCQDQDIIVTVTAGSGGVGSSDIVEFSVDGGNTWFPYITGGGLNTLTLLGTNIVQVRSTRTAGTAIGCNAAVTTLVWTVVPKLVSPSLTPNIASGSTVCESTVLSATMGVGSGGTGVNTDVAEVSTDGGNTWSPYTSGDNILTAGFSGADVIQVRSSRVSTGTGCTTSAYNYVTWTLTPLPAAPICAVPADICAGQSTSFTPTPSSGVTFAYWDAATTGNQVGSGASFATPVLTSNTTYFVEAIAQGCTSATRTPVLVTVLNTNATFTPSSTSIPITGSITYVFTGSARPSASYTWSYPGGMPSSQTGVGPYTITYTTAGTYNVTLAIVDGPCSDTKTTSIVVSNTCLSPSVSTADQITSVSARINWAQQLNVSSYTIRYRASGSTGPWTNQVAPGGSQASSGYISLLTPNTSYRVVLQSTCVAGTASVSTDTFLLTTNSDPQPCASPSITSASQVTSTSMQLNWTPTGNAFSYQILYRITGSTAALTTVTVPGGGTASSMTLGSLTANTSYDFYLRTFCAVDLPMPLSPVFTISTTGGAGFCTSPNIDFIDQLTSNSMRVNWTPGANIAYYQILYKQQGTGTVQNTFNVSGNGSVSSATISPLLANTTYDVQIRAYCTGNFSTTASPVVSASTNNTPPACSTPVVNFADQITSVSMRISWSPNLSASFYQISYKVSGSSQALTTVNVTGNGSASSFIISPLQANAQYDIYLRAYCSGGVAQALSPVFNASTNSLPGPCTTPNISTVDQITSASMRVNWVANPNISFYQLFYRIQGSISAFTAVSVPGGATATSCFLSPLAANTAYEIQLKAFCTGNLPMPNSPSFIASTNVAPPACAVPAVGSVTNVTGTTATINWTPVPGAASYTLYFRVSGVGAYSAVTVSPGTASSRQLTGLALNTAYQFYLRTTCNASLFSANTVVNSFTTAAAMPSGPNLGTLKSAEPTVEAELVEDLSATVYPNPNREGRFTLRIDNVADKNLQISLTDIMGREIIREDAYSQDAEYLRDFNLNLTNGTYILRLVVGRIQLLTRVVVFN